MSDHDFEGFFEQIKAQRALVLSLRLKLDNAKDKLTKARKDYEDAWEQLGVMIDRESEELPLLENQSQAEQRASSPEPPDPDIATFLPGVDSRYVKQIKKFGIQTFDELLKQDRLLDRQWAGLKGISEKGQDQIIKAIDSYDVPF